MPDRILLGGAHPARRAAYVMILLALGMTGLAIWVVTLSGRVGEGEEIRRAEIRAADARQRLATQFVSALVDVSICIPLANIQDLLDGTTLTPKERVDREQAKARYMEKLAQLKIVVPTLEGCDT